MTDIPSTLLRICIVEDNETMREILMTGLSYQGFVVEGFESAEALDAAMQTRSWDIVIIDVGLPGEDGFSLATRLRQQEKSQNLGLVMLTARGGLADRRQGSALADLYFVKPVDLVQFGASLTNLGRRVRASSVPPKDSLSIQPGVSESGRWHLAPVGYILVDPDNRQLKLSMQEHLFLKVMLANYGRPVFRDALVQVLAYDPSNFDMHRLTMTVNRLRKKAEAAGFLLPLRTLRSIGYIFDG